jgi:hypothetical protein
MNSYTDEELDVFQFCFELKKNGCKTSSEAERAIYKIFWNLSYSRIHFLIKHWFHNRDKIEFLLHERAVRTQNESISGIISQTS